MKRFRLLLIGSFVLTNYLWSDGSVTNSGMSYPTNAPLATVERFKPEPRNRRTRSALLPPRRP